MRTEAVKNMKIYAGLRLNASVILGQAVFILSSHRAVSVAGLMSYMDKTFNQNVSVPTHVLIHIV